MALWTAQCGAASCVNAFKHPIHWFDDFRKDPTNHPIGCCVYSPAQKRSWTWSLQRNSGQKRVKNPKKNNKVLHWHGCWYVLQIIFLWYYATNTAFSHTHIHVSINYTQKIYLSFVFAFLFAPSFSCRLKLPTISGCKSPRSDHLAQLAVPRWRVPRRRPKASNPLETLDKCHMKQL